MYKVMPDPSLWFHFEGDVPPPTEPEFTPIPKTSCTVEYHAKIRDTHIVLTELFLSRRPDDNGVYGKFILSAAGDAQFVRFDPDSITTITHHQFANTGMRWSYCKCCNCDGEWNFERGEFVETD